MGKLRCREAHTCKSKVTSLTKGKVEWNPFVSDSRIHALHHNSILSCEGGRCSRTIRGQMLFNITFSLDPFSFLLCHGVALQLCDHLALLMGPSSGYLPSVPFFWSWPLPSFHPHDYSRSTVSGQWNTGPLLTTDEVGPWPRVEE